MRVKKPGKAKTSAIEAILAAQNGYLAGYPGYPVALSEIRRGRKCSCWMWYIWPSLAGVREHRMPHMILSFAESVAYVKHDVLGPRLLEITFYATSQLRRGIKGEILFGWELDSIKFHEACTAFAVAAVANNDVDSALVFAQGITLYGGLNPKVVQVLKSKGNSSVSVYLERVEKLAGGGIYRPTAQPTLQSHKPAPKAHHLQETAVESQHNSYKHLKPLQPPL